MTGGRDGQRGFTLLELLMVVGMLGVVMGAIYSTFIAHKRTAASQGEVAELEQNLRVALDYLTRDLKMAGTLVPAGTTALAAPSGSPPFPNYSTALLLVTASAERRLARVAIDDPPDDEVKVLDTQTSITLPLEAPATATAPNAADGFAAGDLLRLIRPVDGSQPLAGTRTLVVSSIAGNPSRGVFGSAAPGITVSKSDGSTFAVGDVVRSGDMLVKVADAASYPMTVAYYLVESGVTVNGFTCPPRQHCLVREVNRPAGRADIIATNIASLSFRYLDDLYRESPVPIELETVRAVRINLQGTTGKTVALSGGARLRSVATVVRLRSRR